MILPREIEETGLTTEKSIIEILVLPVNLQVLLYITLP